MNGGKQGRLVSIVIPCHNEERFIAEAIESALSQTYSPIEVIVVDDGSEDSSSQVVESFASKVRFLRQPWTGAPAARNRGASRARGEFVMFLDGDDVIAPDTIGALVEALAGRRDTLAACRWGVLSPCCEGTWQVTKAPHDPPDSDDPLLEWLQGRFVPSCTLLWPMDVFLNTGGWDDSLVANQDGDLAFRAFLNGARLHVASHGYALYREDSRKRRVSNVVGSDALSSRIAVLNKVRAKLLEGKDWERYKVILGRAYYYLGVHYFSVNFTKAHECWEIGQLLAGRASVPGGISMRVMGRAFGLRGSVAAWRARRLLGKTARALGLRGRCNGRCEARVMPRESSECGLTSR